MIDTMKDKIKIINDILKSRLFKAEQLEYINIDNLIFSLNNIGKHYLTINRGITWYCWKCIHEGLPKNDFEIKEYCSYDNLHKSLHDTDYNRRVRLVCGAEDDINKLLNYIIKQ